MIHSLGKYFRNQRGHVQASTFDSHSAEFLVRSSLRPQFLKIGKVSRLTTCNHLALATPKSLALTILHMLLAGGIAPGRQSMHCSPKTAINGGMLLELWNLTLDTGILGILAHTAPIRVKSVGHTVSRPRIILLLVLVFARVVG
jgi:hypothetical protein